MESCSLEANQEASEISRRHAANLSPSPSSASSPQLSSRLVLSTSDSLLSTDALLATPSRSPPKRPLHRRSFGLLAKRLPAFDACCSDSTSTVSSEHLQDSSKRAAEPPPPVTCSSAHGPALTPPFSPFAAAARRLSANTPPHRCVKSNSLPLNVGRQPFRRLPQPARTPVLQNPYGWLSRATRRIARAHRTPHLPGNHLSRTQCPGPVERRRRRLDVQADSARFEQLRSLQVGPSHPLLHETIDRPLSPQCTTSRSHLHHHLGTWNASKALGARRSVLTRFDPQGAIAIGYIADSKRVFCDGGDYTTATWVLRGIQWIPLFGAGWLVSSSFLQAYFLASSEMDGRKLSSRQWNYILLISGLSLFALQLVS